MPGAYYELPTNEFENSDLGIGNRTTNPSMIYNWVQCANAIYAVDSTAHLMGPCTDGVYDTYGLVLVSDVLNTSTGFLNPAGGNWAGPWSGHNENSNQNQSDIVMLRQYIGSIKAQFATSGFTNLDLWATETGINGGLYGVLSGRRDARQRTLFRHIWELYGFSCQNLYDFRWEDVHGSGLTTYMVDVPNGSSAGSLRMGGPAIHEMGENLFGTSCSPTNTPTKVSFGAIGSIGDESFSGSFYSGTSWDLFEIFSNLESDTVTFTVSNPTGLTASDGLGRPRSLSISGDTVTVATDDLCTYVRMPTGSSPPVVVDTGSTIISQFNSAVNLALSAAFSASTTTNIARINNGSFAENNSGITGIEAPFVDPTVPDTITATDLGGSSSAKYVGGVVIKSAGPAWQSYGCSITGFTVTGKNGATVVGTESYSCASAVSYPIPSPSNGNSSDICSRTTWWTNPQMWVLPLSFSGPVTEIDVHISGTGIGGQPDTAASNSNLTPVRIGTSRYANIYSTGSTYTLAGLYTYTTTTTSNIVTLCPATFDLDSVTNASSGGGQFTVQTSGTPYEAVIAYTGVLGSTLIGCSYVSGGTGSVSSGASIQIAGDGNVGDGLEVDWDGSTNSVFVIPAGISTYVNPNNPGPGFCFRLTGSAASLTIQGGSGVTLTGDLSIGVLYGQLTAGQTSQDHWTISPFPFSEYFAGDKTQVIQLSEIQILEASAAAATGAGVASFAAAGTASVKEPGTGAAAATFTAHGTATTAGGASGGNPFQMNLLRLAG